MSNSNFCHNVFNSYSKVRLFSKSLTSHMLYVGKGYTKHWFPVSFTNQFQAKNLFAMRWAPVFHLAMADPLAFLKVHIFKGEQINWSLHRFQWNLSDITFSPNVCFLAFSPSPGGSVGSDAGCQSRGCEFESRLGQLSFRGLTKVNATCIIHLPPMG